MSFSLLFFFTANIVIYHFKEEEVNALGDVVKYSSIPINVAFLISVTWLFKLDPVDSGILVNYRVNQFFDSNDEIQGLGNII